MPKYGEKTRLETVSLCWIGYWRTKFGERLFAIMVYPIAMWRLATTLSKTFQSNQLSLSRSWLRQATLMRWVLIDKRAKITRRAVCCRYTVNFTRKAANFIRRAIGSYKRAKVWCSKYFIKSLRLESKIFEKISTIWDISHEATPQNKRLVLSKAYVLCAFDLFNHKRKQI